ncbi:alpha/beta hydrolase [Agrococcus baldri]|uniref:Alpha/beta hydrolase n=1 Tax=Agrococcus baldri TaxID=153730 RepID=A0AA87REN5_9MICO|nr:alpha/beta hydrolase [Agrococcus baldri]GEK81337.1 alpha/beta hydrolase [Agrococcus baldri]
MITAAPTPSPSRPRRIRPLLAAGAAVLLLSACAGGAPPPEPSADASLDRFYQQQPAFEACEIPVPGADPVAGECAQLEVPIDYEQPEGDVAQVAVFRIEATGDAPIGSLLVNPGGPGFPGIGFAAQMAQAWAGSLVTERFDLVGFDPRGTGATTPAVDCLTDAERETDAVTASRLTIEGVPPLVESCADSVGGVDALAHLGTRDVARDMDVLRGVLGDEELSYAGSSYGTRLGAVYAEMFPERVRALVLDGAMDPHSGTLERREVQWAGLQRSFEQFAEYCVAQGDCPLGEDAAGATAAYQQLVRPLIDEPLPTGDGRTLTFDAANDAVVTAMYSEETWPVLVTGLTRLSQGGGETMLAVRDAYHGRTAEGTYPNDAEATLAINCLDEDRFSPQGQAELMESALASAPFLDPGTEIEPVADACEGWPVEPTLGFPHATGIEGLPATLTVSVTGDGLTPHSGGISMAETLGGSLLTVEGEQHGTLVSGNECVDAAIASYLVDLETPDAGATCTR